MCGILGIWGGELSNLKHANDLQSHRGPDDTGLFIDHLSKIKKDIILRKLQKKQKGKEQTT